MSRGRGLETEWKGWLNITGTAAAPVIEGELENLRGRLRVVGKDFSLEQSKISFAGTSDIAPLLDIRAVNQSDDLEVTVTVTGTPDQPTITLSSVPFLPQEEILARILFGKSTAQLSAIEAVQLASSLAELSGSGLGGAGVLDFTRDLIGVDVLDVGTSDGAAGGAEVSAGKYIHRQRLRRGQARHHAGIERGRGRGRADPETSRSAAISAPPATATSGSSSSWTIELPPGGTNSDTSLGIQPARQTVHRILPQRSPERLIPLQPDGSTCLYVRRHHVAAADRVRKFVPALDPT